MTGVSGGSPDKAFEKVNGPFGFDEAVQLKEDKAMVKADFKVRAFESKFAYERYEQLRLPIVRWVFYRLISTRRMQRSFLKIRFAK